MRVLVAFLAVTAATCALAFAPTSTSQYHGSTSALYAKNNKNDNEIAENSKFGVDRKFFLGATVGAATMIPRMAFAEEEESFASIAARASKLSSDIGEKTATTQVISDDPRTAYDFSLPIQGDQVPFDKIVNQEKNAEGVSKVKAVLVVNMKQDDPVARKDIPEFIALAAK
jgi:hypothetical protein